MWRRLAGAGACLVVLVLLGSVSRPIDWMSQHARAEDNAAVEQPAAAAVAITDEPVVERLPNRPRVPGTLRLRVRERMENADGGVKSAERTVEWQAADTAIIVCDMWDDHYCRMAAQRVGVMAPRMNRVLSAARERGMMIIHAPSGTMDFYAATPYRQRMLQAPQAEPPVPIANWCYLDPEHEPPMPVVAEQENASDDPIARERKRMYSRQHAEIDVIGYDGVSDQGAEIYNFCRQEGIKNIAIMGVHTNMCVLGRSFGIRQMTRLGMNLVLVRDLTDAMYDPRQPPHVSHARGTELVIEHVEQYWCPSIDSGDLTRVVHGSDGPNTAAASEQATR